MKAPLTQREQEVLFLVETRGHQRKIAARILGISPETVKSTIRKARLKRLANTCTCTCAACASGRSRGIG